MKTFGLLLCILLCVKFGVRIHVLWPKSHLFLGLVLVRHTMIIVGDFTSMRITTADGTSWAFPGFMSSLPIQERYRSDCNVAVQMLQCRPSNYLAHKLNTVSHITFGEKIRKGSACDLMWAHLAHFASDRISFSSEAQTVQSLVQESPSASLCCAHFPVCFTRGQEPSEAMRQKRWFDNVWRWREHLKVQELTLFLFCSFRWIYRSASSHSWPGRRLSIWRTRRTSRNAPRWSAFPCRPSRPPPWCTASTKCLLQARPDPRRRRQTTTKTPCRTVCLPPSSPKCWRRTNPRANRAASTSVANAPGTLFLNTKRRRRRRWGARSTPACPRPRPGCRRRGSVEVSRWGLVRRCTERGSTPLKLKSRSGYRSKLPKSNLLINPTAFSLRTILTVL